MLGHHLHKHAGRCNRVQGEQLEYGLQQLRDGAPVAPHQPAWGLRGDALRGEVRIREDKLVPMAHLFVYGDSHI